jgi:hypothetical protein
MVVKVYTRSSRARDVLRLLTVARLGMKIVAVGLLGVSQGGYIYFGRGDHGTDCWGEGTQT